ncbi:hypothetical protein [Wenjunlia tyrosinilytica]|uniref:hypothetical protein n=1 Tax=Wenjunlia tyrosinilytica TaxID=1544741 RepID=UPI00166DD40D|nr:hypothetical protein [Wenjunlia tyrosinilytica]
MAGRPDRPDPNGMDLVESPVLGDGHAGFGGRVGETHREQSRQGAPARPGNLCGKVPAEVAPRRLLGHGR